MSEEPPERNPWAAPSAREELRQRLERLLGRLYDAIDPPPAEAGTIGEQARRRRQRDRFVEAGLALARELVRAARGR